MPDSPEIAIPRHFRRILLAGVLLVAVGFGVWRGLLREQVTLVNPLSSPVQQKELSASQKAQATAEQLDRVAHDHNASPEERRIAFESIGDAAASRGNFDAAFEAYISAETLAQLGEQQPNVKIHLGAQASGMLRKTGQLRAASELFSSVVLNGWLYGLPNREALQLEGEQLYAQLNPSNSKEDKLAIHRRVFTIRESVLGAQHPLLAWDLDEFARTLTEFGKLEEAVGYSRRSLEISLAASGDSWVTFERLETMTSALMSIDKIDEAVSYARKAVVIFEKKLDPRTYAWAPIWSNSVNFFKNPLIRAKQNPYFGEPWRFCFNTRLTETYTIHILYMTWPKFTMTQTI